MARSSNFKIHVDDACLTDSTDLRVPSKRNTSDQTVIHNDIDDLHTEPNDSQVGSELSQVSHDEHTEALIHAAARAVVASIERDGYGQEGSELSGKTDDGYEAGTEGTEVTYGNGTELTYGDTLPVDYDSEADHDHHDAYDGSASSHHEDDVFSQGNGRSNRSSLNSITDEEQLKSAEENENKQDAYLEEEEGCQSQISRMPSTCSNAVSLRPQPLTITSSPHPHTPNKVQRPPFRTPSSVRALQMSSPTPSVFGSPRSSKRPNISRLGTPNTNNESATKNKSPIRFKAKKEYPLVLLHVTVLPLRWPFGDALDSVAKEGLSRELQGVRGSWNLLKEKLADTVLERGILLPHPQDLYEVLEERLLEALELPVRPRAKILSCGHYIGPDDTEDISSEDDSENEDNERNGTKRERWCDICRTEVKYEELGVGGKQKRFKVKVYASNGLMRAGAWGAAWREMERVDVEIEPSVAPHLLPLMNSLIMYHVQPPQAHVFHAGDIEHMREQDTEAESRQTEDEAVERRRQMEEDRMREIYGHDAVPQPPVDGHPRPQVVVSSQQRYGDSLPELLLEAIKVTMRDKKHVAICILSVLVVILALRPTSSPQYTRDTIVASVPAISNTARAPDLSNIGRECAGISSQQVDKIPTPDLGETVHSPLGGGIERVPVKSTQQPPLAASESEIRGSEVQQEVMPEKTLEPEQEATEVPRHEQVVLPELATYEEKEKGIADDENILVTPEILRQEVLQGA